MVMLGLLVLMLLLALALLGMAQLMRRQIHRIEAALKQAETECTLLTRSHAEDEALNAAFLKGLEEQIGLYELTKQVCRSLDAEKVFLDFREFLQNHIKLTDCQLLKPDENVANFQEYDLAPLKIGHRCVGYLAARGIAREDADTYHILSHQFMLGIKRAFLYQHVQELAITDTLTGAFTRRYYMERFNEEVERSKRFKYNFSFLMVDVDHFKESNDRYGHLVGDVILREVVKTIKENIRQIDSIGRYGGEEFIIILTETDKNGARFAAERIRQAVEARRIKAYDEELKVTISIGVATFPEDAQETMALIERSDKALYRAKQTGRNRVCMHGVYR